MADRHRAMIPVGPLTALAMEAALLVFFLVFTFVFTWVFDWPAPIGWSGFDLNA